ncbi:MAG: hypothetical protein ABFS37_08850 [Acidobacteriota bacterium]
MVHFLSFLVGLVVGIHPVEVAVTGPVSHVEIRLDGETVAELKSGPWRTEIDLGPTLKPALLEARAFDKEGRLLGRDRQWLNSPRPRAEGVVIPRLDKEGFVIGARLQWHSAEFLKPKGVDFRLDGESVTHDSELSVDLRGADPSTLHVLDAEIRFPDHVVVREQLVFGRGFSGDLSLHLTALPVFVDDPGAFPPSEGLGGWFEAKGKPVEVADIEKGSAQLVVVRGSSVDDHLKALELKVQVSSEEGRDDRLSDDVLYRVIGTIPTGGPRGDARLFPFSHPKTVGRKGLADELEKARFGDLQFGLHRRADAVALAGLQAAAGNQRRAVLLILGPGQEDSSTHSPAAVRAYLEALRVPLLVFDVAGASPAAEAWRPVDEVVDPLRWISSVEWLQEDLDSQRIVWLVGRHLPSDITLGPKAEGIELVR